MKKKTFVFILSFILCMGAFGKDYLVSTKNTSLLISAKPGEKSRIHYYGARITSDQVSGVYDAGLALWSESYPAFGIHSYEDKAIQVTHSDGNMSLDLVVEVVNQFSTDEADITEILLKDKEYPFVLKQYYKAYKETDVISTWVEVTNKGKKPLTMYKFASAYLCLPRGDNWLTHYHGNWGAENMLEEEKLTTGQKIITNKDGTRNNQCDSPAFMLTLDGEAEEEDGHVLGATLAWSGNYRLKIEANNHHVRLFGGINEDASHYVLEPKETFVTPEFAMTYSTNGKGGVSRAFHRWALKHKLNQGHLNRDILLNSWEGVYFKVNQEGMDQMMKNISAMGGELFVMDDGWFGDKYPRDNGSTSLGDWMVCKEKLPEGIEGLLTSAKKHKIKFGIWIEPEFSNTKSELFEKHPEWVLSQPNRPLSTGRGRTQVVLDLANPDVQDFVFKIVDDLLSNYPEIAYIKWDANCSVMNYGSDYLSKKKQSHIYIDYHKGLNKVLERIRAKYPKVVMQVCASGGGRINYGLLPYFEEWWTSDNTDALQRIYIQWGVSDFYPAAGMASHVSANENHQTGRQIPLKFRFDVAMSGRLGMEIQPKDISDEEKAFAKRAIEAYKGIRPVVQQGDLYRLVSPYEKKGLASLMYVTPEKDRAVFFAYRTSLLLNQIVPRVRMTGVDPQKKYKLIDLTPLNDEKPCSLHNKEVSGKILLEEGIVFPVPRNKEYTSVALELVEIK